MKPIRAPSTGYATLSTIRSQRSRCSRDRESRIFTDADLLRSPDQIHTGLITAGLATSSSGSMFAHVEQRVKASKNVLVASISAVDCTNLKSSLKAILGNVSSWVESEDEDDVVPNS